MGNKDDLKFTWELDESKRPLDLIKSRGTWILVWNKAHKKYHMTGTEAQRLLDELGRVLHRETIEAHLPESFALEDDLTVEFAIKLAGQDKKIACLRSALEKAVDLIMYDIAECPYETDQGCPYDSPCGEEPTLEVKIACWLAAFGAEANDG